MRSRAHLGPLLAAALFVVLLPLLGLAEMRLRERRLAGTDPNLQTYDMPPAAYLRALAFGYNELGADLLWVRCISYFADELFLGRRFMHLDRHLDSILALDPRYKAIYRYGPAMLVSRKASSRSNREVLAAIALLKQGNRRFPNDWQMAMAIGNYYMFELRPESEAQRRGWLRQGADWINRAALIGADIPWLPGLAAKIYTEQGQRELAIRHLQELYMASQDERMKQEIYHKLGQLRAQKVARELKQAGESTRQAHEGSPLNFVPLDLFLLVQQDAPGPFSLKAILEGG